MRVRYWILLMLVCLAGFAALTADVLHDGAIKRVDSPVGVWLHAHVPAWMILPAAAGSGLGNVGVCLPVVLATAALLVKKRRWRMLGVGAMAVGLELLLINTVKPWAGLPRPDSRFTNWVLDTGYTYPSGHTLGAMVVYGVAAMALAEVWPARKRLWWSGAGAIWVIVGAALLTVGVHFVTDVVGAWLLGGAVVAGATAAMAWKQKSPSV